MLPKQGLRFNQICMREANWCCRIPDGPSTLRGLRWSSFGSTLHVNVLGTSVYGISILLRFFSFQFSLSIKYDLFRKPE